MATWGCAGCRTSYRVRLFRCPRCHGTAFEEENMPKISRSGGATHAAAEHEQDAVARPPATGGIVENPPVVGEAADPVAIGDLSAPLTEEGAEQVEQIGAAHEGEGQREVVLGEEEPSAGSSSETSPPRPPSSPVTSGSDLPKRAPKMGSRSKQARTGSSTARSTATSGEGDG